MPPGMGPMGGASFGTELIYVFVIIVSSLMVYFGTKELYELSNHKGIKYFRQAFLFFALAFFFRSFMQLVIVMISEPSLVSLTRSIFPIVNPFSMFLFIYFSSMSIFYLIYSALWKSVYQKSNLIFLLHVVAFFIAGISIYFRSPFVYLFLNVLLFVFVLVITVYAYLRSRRKKSRLFTIYVLLFFFWILNIVDILVPNFLRTFQLFVYLASIGLFLTILFKVLKKSGGA